MGGGSLIVLAFRVGTNIHGRRLFKGGHLFE